MLRLNLRLEHGHRAHIPVFLGLSNREHLLCLKVHVTVHVPWSVEFQF